MGLVLLSALPTLAWAQDTSLTAAMTRGLHEEGLVGAVWAAVHSPGDVRLGAAGRRQANEVTPLGPADRVQVGSVAKTLVAAGILRLVTEGRLTLDAHVSDLLPFVGLRNAWAELHPLTLRHLLDHTSGLDDARLWQLFSDEPRPDMPLRAGFDPDRLRLTVRHPPGQRFSYSNTGYGLLGLVIEVVTRQRYEAYLDAHLLRPMGMANSTFEFVTQAGPRADRRLAMGHFEKGALAPAVPTFLRPAMQFTTTAADMARFATFLMSDGRVNGAPFVDPALLSAMGTPIGTEAARAGLAIGYALGLGMRDRHGVVGRCHAGNTVGYRAMLCLYRADRKAFFIAMNADNEDANYVRLDSLVVGTLRLTPTPRPTPRPSSGDIRRWHGTYVLAPPRFEMFAYLDVVLDFVRIAADGSSLAFIPFQGTTVRLEPMGGRLFRAPGRTLASHALYTSPSGTLALTDGLRTYERMSLWYMVRLWGSLVLGVLGLVYLLVRGLIAAVRGRLGPSAPLFVPFLVVAALLPAALLLLRQSVLALGAVTPANVLLAVITAALPAAAAVGLWRISRQQVGSPWTAATTTDAVALVGVLQWAIVLAFWGLLPLRLWS
jgi:CubicO group peptidase (beta-lactamase class C family)